MERVFSDQAGKGMPSKDQIELETLQFIGCINHVVWEGQGIQSRS